MLRRTDQEANGRDHRLRINQGFPDWTGTKNPRWTLEEDQIIRDYDECRIAYSEMLEALE